MPRIRHWFHVSHDINSDGEVWELTDQFGVSGLRVWLELLSIADRNGGEIPINSEATLRQLSIKCNTTQRHLRGILEFIQRRLWITSDPSPKVRNWLIYNPTREHKSKAEASPPLPTPHPSPSPTPIKPPISPLKGDVTDLSFEVFWKEYPKKAGKVSAIKAWKKEAAILKDIQEKIMEALPRHKGTEQWQKDGGRFVPHAATWLNQRRWEDEVEEVEDIYSEPGRTTEEILAELNARHPNGKR